MTRRKSTKTIDGVMFLLVGFGNKSEMNSEASRIRELGYNARIFYNKEGKFYEVYQSITKRKFKY